MKIHLKFNHFLKKGVLLLGLPLLLLMSCKGEDYEREIDIVEIIRVGGITVNTDGDQLSEFMGDLVVSESLGLVYGVDLRIMKAYQLSLETGEVLFLAPKGRGPEELNIPAQITKKAENHFLIFDNGLDVIAELNDGTIQKKYPGVSEHNVWLRNFKGFYNDGFIITGIVEPGKIRAMDFENASPIALIDYKNGKIFKKGKFSPTIDNLDSDNKYPIVYFDEGMNSVFYVFRTDYTVMKYDLNTDITTVLESYSPTKFRTRTLAVQGSSEGNISAAMALGIDVSLIMGVDRIGDKLIVVWKNFNEGFYENMGDYSAGNVDYFGVMYDLPNLDNPREFTLPGRFFGTYKNKLLIEEEYGSMDLKIGFYELESTSESSP
ncbi:MAG: hypothetical protein JJU37_03715 [Balneolaceae bacterium]|nr:hypothetical protein [Balneolaceae bacterium]